MGRRFHGRGLTLELLSRPGYERLWAAVRRRLESNGLSLDGTPITLKGVIEEEADAVAGLMGVRRPPPGASMRVSLRALDSALRSSSVGLGLADVLSQIGGPLVDRRAGKALTDAERARRWQALATHPALGADARLEAWFDHVRTTGLARRLAGGDEGAAMGAALDVVAMVSTNTGHRLGILAARLTGDAHGLDRGRSSGTLAVHALCWLAERPFPQDAADWRRAWAEAGVACDDLSCDVLVLNLDGWAPEPLRLTLRQASAWRGPQRNNGVVFACENPAVVAAASDRLGDRSPTMVCTDGMPSTASLVVLDNLAKAGWAVVRHGDFDWRGLGIAAVLARKIPSVRPWRFATADYERAVQRGVGTVALSGRPSLSPWDPKLAAAMEAASVAVYEEKVLDDLMSDPARTRWSPGVAAAALG